MLVAALVVTLVGFVLLVVALITSSVAFAWACIVICLIGFGLLLADVLGLRKSKAAATPAAAPVGGYAPAVETPAVETPESETSAFETPVVEAPAPVVESAEDVEPADHPVASEPEQDPQDKQ